jgi:hypothetical protein
MEDEDQPFGYEAAHGGKENQKPAVLARDQYVLSAKQ